VEVNEVRRAGKEARLRMRRRDEDERGRVGKHREGRAKRQARSVIKSSVTRINIFRLLTRQGSDPASGVIGMTRSDEKIFF
jgi:hypothetical protein